MSFIDDVAKGENVSQPLSNGLMVPIEFFTSQILIMQSSPEVISCVGIS